MKKDQEKSLSYEEQIKIAHKSFVSFDQHIISKLLDRDKKIHILTEITIMTRFCFQKLKVY